MEVCFVIWPMLCATLTDSFPFWEMLVSVLATGIVTFFTIFFSVKISREQTERSIAAEREASSDIARHAFAQQLTALWHAIESNVEAPSADRNESIAQRSLMASVAARSSTHDQAEDLVTMLDLVRDGFRGLITPQARVDYFARISEHDPLRLFSDWALDPGSVGARVDAIRKDTLQR